MEITRCIKCTQCILGITKLIDYRDRRPSMAFNPMMQIL